MRREPDIAVANFGSATRRQRTFWSGDLASGVRPEAAVPIFRRGEVGYDQLHADLRPCEKTVASRGTDMPAGLSGVHTRMMPPRVCAHPVCAVVIAASNAAAAAVPT